MSGKEQNDGGRDVRFGIPKGRMEDGVLVLLRDAGVGVSASARSYRPSISLDGFDVKILKPRAIVEMLAIGSRAVGFAGADWVAGGAQGATVGGNYIALMQIGALSPGVPLTNNMTPGVPFSTGGSSLSSLFTLTASVVPGNYPINLAAIGVGFFGVSGPQTIGSYTVVPEPTTAALMGLGLLGLATAGRKR